MGPATTPPLDADLRTLSELLWRYRDVLESIEYHLEVHGLLISAGADRWLGRAADHLSDGITDLTALDHRRADAVTRVAGPLGLEPGASLRELAARAPEPWGDILTDHATWLLPAMARLAEASARTRSSVTSGLARLHDALGALVPTGGATYDHAGRAVSSAGGSLLFDGRA